MLFIFKINFDVKPANIVTYDVTTYFRNIISLLFKHLVLHTSNIQIMQKKCYPVVVCLRKFEDFPNIHRICRRITVFISSDFQHITAFLKFNASSKNAKNINSDVHFRRERVHFILLFLRVLKRCRWIW